MDVLKADSDVIQRLEDLDSAAGRACSLMLADTSWLHREVDSVRIASNGDTRRHVSMDLTVPASSPMWPLVRYDPGPRTKARLFTNRLGSALCAPDAREYRALPIGFLRKSAIQRLNVSESGTPLPVLTSRQNGELSVLFLNSLLDELSFYFEGAPSALVELRELAMEVVMHPGAETSTTDSSDSSFSAQKRVGEVLGRARLCEMSLSSLLGDESFLRLVAYLNLLRDSFMFAVVIPSSWIDTRRVVKYSLDQPMNLSRGRSWKRIFSPLEINYTPSNVFHDSGYHFELELPDDLRVRSVRVDGQPRDLSDVRNRLHLAWPRSIADKESGIDSLVSVATGSKLVQLEVTAQHQGLRSFSMHACWVVAVFFATAFAEMFLDRIVRGDFVTPTPAASVILVGPALMLSWMAREPEHPIVAFAMFSLRAALLLCTFMLFYAALLLAVPVVDNIWTASWIGLSAFSIVLLIGRVAWGIKNRLPGSLK